MIAPRKPSPAESPLLFELDDKPLNETLTAYTGAPLVVHAFRSLGAPAGVARHVHLKRRQRGYDEATMVESLVVLNALGGECLDDFQHLREDAGLKAMLGHVVPSPEAARKFLNQFHAEAKMGQAKQRREPEQIAFIPEETDALTGLGEVNRELVRELGRRCPEQRIGTVDQDATIIESHKREALRTYEGERGYQPMLAVWAEMDAVLADEFRDGNVPAMMAPLEVARRAFQALPETVEEFYLRGDSACDEDELLSWLRNEKREDGSQAKIGFAVSARMNAGLQAAVRGIGEARWQPYSEDARAIKECAEVDYAPEESSGYRYREPLRYVAIRIRKRQGELFADGSAVKHFAVMTNLWEWPAKKLPRWHHEKAGSIEAAHNVIKKDLPAE